MASLCIKAVVLTGSFGLLFAEFGFSLTVDDVFQKASLDKSSNVTGNSNELIESLYPALKKDPTRPTFNTSVVYRVCDQFAPNRTAPPNPQGDDPTYAQAVFSIDRLVEFKDVEETMKVSALFWLYWKVPCNQTMPLENDVQRLFVSRSQVELKDDIWLPAYIFRTSSSDIFMKSEEFGTDLIATATNNPDTQLGGTLFEFYYVRRGFYEAQCKLDLRKFPFDTQWCPFSFALQRSDNLIQFDKFNVFPICPSAKGTEWDFSNCGANVYQARLSGNNVSVVDFQIVVKRKPEFYIINLALPSICLSLLELATFLMPPDKPDRPTFAVTIVLALTVAQSDVLKDVPKTSDRILLSDYILLLSWFSSLVTFYEMLGCCLSNYGDSKKFLKREVKWGCTCGFMRALDGIVFIFAVLCYAGINAYAAYVITTPVALKPY